MCANTNVARAEGVKNVILKTDKRIVGAKWLDNGQKVEKVKKNEFVVAPFDYGYSYGSRVARFELK